LEIPEELSDSALYAQGRSFYKTIAAERERYILVFNLELCVTRKQDRQDKTAKAKAEITELDQDAASAAKSRQLEPLRNKVTEIISRLKLTQIFKPTFDEVLIIRDADNLRRSKPTGCSNGSR
jgi:hypothetical protein